MRTVNTESQQRYTKTPMQQYAAWELSFYNNQLTQLFFRYIEL
jgi:hypothetical protein